MVGKNKLFVPNKLGYHYSKYTEAGKPKSKMADYKNVINPRLLYLEEDPDNY